MKRLIEELAKEKSSPTGKLKEIEPPTFDDSELGKLFLESHMSKSQAQLASYSKVLLTSVFEKENFAAAAKEAFSTMKSSSKPVCGKILTKNDIGFKCLDCEKDPTCIICKDCFENADHKNHRILVQKSVAGCCDCGDPDAWQESGFCKNHPGYAKFKPDVSVDDLPEQFRVNFKRDISKAFYYLCLSVESAVAEGSNVKQSAFKPIMSAIEFCGMQNMVVLNLVCKILAQPYPEKCNLYHNCKDLQEKEYSGNLKECQCTLLEILFRNQRFLPSNDQKEFEEFMIKLFLDYEFKQYIAETYIKMLYYVYNFFGDHSPSQRFHLSSLAVQLFTAEEFAIIAIKSNYCRHMIELFELVAKNYNSSVENSFRLLMEVYQVLEFVSQKSHCRQLLLKTNGFFEGLLQGVASFQYVVKFAPHMPTPFISEDLDKNLIHADIEFYLTKYCDIMLRELNEMDDPVTRLTHQKRVATIFKELLNSQHNDEDNMRSIHIPLHRAFSHFVKSGAGSFDTNAIRRFMLESFGFDEQQLSAFCLKVFKGVLHTIGFVRDQEKRCWEKYGSRLDPYVRIYFNITRLKFFDLDFFLLQAMARFVQQDQLFRCFLLNYSLYPPYTKFIEVVLAGKDLNDLKAALNDLDKEAQEKVIAKLEELANLYLQMNIEDIEYANLLTRSEKFFGDSKPDGDLAPEQISAYKRLLINLFQYKPTFDMKKLKKTLSAQILDEKINLEVPLFEVATFDKTSKTFMAKPQYKNVYEPFSFMKDMQLQIETIESLKNKFKGTDDLDLIIGKHSFLYEPDGNLLFELQKCLFSPQFFEFFKRIFSICLGLEKPSSYFFRPILKLVHLGLFHIEKKYLSALKPILADDEMTQILNTALGDKRFSDYENAIGKMIALINKLNTANPSNEMDIEPMSEIARQSSSKIDLETSKKKQMELKMKFLQKQKNFMQQHAHTMQEESKTGEKKTEELLCYLCHSKIEPETQAFGVPGYAARSNIHEFAVFQTNMRTIVEEDVSELLPSFREEALKYDLKSQKFGSCMQLDSCYHIMHRKCFETSKTVNQDLEFHFNNEIEYFCKVCKRLSNVFVESYLSSLKKSENEGKKEAMDQEMTIKSIEDLRNCMKNMMVEDKNKKPETKDAEGESKNFIFDTLIMLELFMGENDSKVAEKDDAILEVTERIFEYAVKAVDILGVKHFMTKNLDIHRSLRIMYLRYYEQYISQTKKTFSSAKYEKLLNFVELSENPDSKAAENANFITSNLDEFFYNSLVHVAITSQLSEVRDSLKEVLSRLCFLAILQMILKVYWIKLIKTKAFTQPEISVDQFFKEVKENQAFRAEAAKSLLPLMRRLIVLGFLFDPSIEDAEVKLFQQEEFYEDFEELDFYLKHSLFKTTSSALFSEDIMDKCLLKKEMLQKHFDKLYKTLKSDTPQVPLDLIFSSKEVQFHLIDLPDNFLDLSRFYIDQKCVQCMDHSQLGSKCVCLICEQVLCSFACKKTGANITLGNLNTHATKYHAGCSAFLSIETGTVLLINSPKNIDYGPLYVDKFGQKFTGKNRDWKEYNLDRVMLNKLKDMIQKNAIPQEICYAVMKSEKKIIDGIM